MLKAFYLDEVTVPLVINASEHDTAIFFDYDAYCEFKESGQSYQDVVIAANRAGYTEPSEIGPNTVE